MELSRVPFQRLRVYYPSSKQEQVKIAEVLSAVDQAIEQTEALIAKYRRVKMGLMQDLFTRGIDEHGDLRDPTIHQFKLSPLGQVPEEWDVVTVESVGSVNLGRQRSPTHHNGPFMTPYLRVANVFDGWIDYTDVLEMNFTPTERKVYSLVPGDILLNEGQSLELVGRSAIFDGPKNTYCFQNTLVRFRCYERNEPAFCQAVFKYWLDTSRFQLAAKQTTSIAHLGADRFAKMPFARPKQDEQKRIAVVLEAQERSLSLQSSQLANLKRLKTGLMQDLLTGKVSVEPLLTEEAIAR